MNDEDNPSGPDRDEEITNTQLASQDVTNLKRTPSNLRTQRRAGDIVIEVC